MLTYLEYSVKPEELGRKDLTDDFLELTVAMNYPLLPVTFDITTRAFQLRAAYKSLKAMDALQLATAIVSGCQTFVTNDKRLKVVAELNMLVLADMAW